MTGYTVEQLIENWITRIKHKQEHPYEDMSDEHLLCLYNMNLLLYKENHKKIKGEQETTQSDVELIEEKYELYKMIVDEHDELCRRNMEPIPVPLDCI